MEKKRSEILNRIKKKIAFKLCTRKIQNGFGKGKQKSDINWK